MKFRNNSNPVYFIQENGLISSTQWADGRLIPVVVLNSKNGIELKDFLSAHVSSIDQGDVITQWGYPFSQFFKPKVWILSIQFKKPRTFSFYIEFVLDKNPALIDAIFQSRGLYIRYGFPGEKISKGMDQDMVLIEIPDLKRDEEWNNTLRDILRSRFKKQNIDKKKLKDEVEKQIKKMREILHHRIS